MTLEQQPPNAYACPIRPSDLRPSSWTTLNRALTGGPGRWIFHCGWLDLQFFAAGGTFAAGKGEQKEVVATSAEETGGLLKDAKDAKNVIIVPGYGMAGAQAELGSSCHKQR